MAEYHIEPLSYRSKVRATWENVIIVRSLKRDVLRENVESFMCSINGLHWRVCIWLLSLFESIAAAKKNQRGSCFVSKINLSIRKSSSMWLKQNHLHMCMQTHDFSWRWRLMIFEKTVLHYPELLMDALLNVFQQWPNITSNLCHIDRRWGQREKLCSLSAR